MRRALVVAALASGCVLDFESVLARRGDAATPRDVSTTDAPDAPPPADAAVDAADAKADVADVAEPTDTAPGCEPSDGARVRLAHMATGFGSVNLCMRRGTASFAAVDDTRWPAAGVAEAQVSAPFATNAVVTQQNESWQFAVVTPDVRCEDISARTPAVASLTTQLDPGDRATLLFTAQEISLGRVVGVLGLLMDKACTSCPQNSIDVRAVHAALGASAARLEFAIDYVMPGAAPSLVNVFFAQSVGYGSTSPTGDRGFDCDSAWFIGSTLPLAFPVGLSAFEVGGDAVANSDRFNIKAPLLSRARLVTVYFRGAWPKREERPEFVVCYDGAYDAGLTSCDRVAATAIPRDDAGRADVPEPDASTSDAMTREDVAEPADAWDFDAALHDDAAAD